MCVIVDASVADLVLAEAPLREGFRPLHDAIFGDKRPHATLVYGGTKMADEFTPGSRRGRILLRLLQMGRARRLDKKKVDAEAKAIKRSKRLRSNDAHIIAVARIGNVRLVATRDNDLITDLSTLSIIGPAASIYVGYLDTLTATQRRERVSLIRKHCAGARTRKLDKGERETGRKKEPRKKEKKRKTQPARVAKPKRKPTRRRRSA